LLFSVAFRQSAGWRGGSSTRCPVGQEVWREGHEAVRVPDRRVRVREGGGLRRLRRGDAWGADEISASAVNVRAPASNSNFKKQPFKKEAVFCSCPSGGV